MALGNTIRNFDNKDFRSCYVLRKEWIARALDLAQQGLSGGI